MSKSINQELTSLIEAEVITIATAVKIQDFYKAHSGQSQNRLVIMFGILGAMLMGMGIILLIAHNWDELSKLTKTIIAFLPLLLGQYAAAFSMLKKPNSVAWREGATTFLFFAIGASISIVSQIYHIHGSLGDFLLTWSVLCLPLIYLMRSSVGSLLYIIGISWYAVWIGWDWYTSSHTYWYWLLFAAVLPHYYMLYRKSPNSNFLSFHHWVVPISLIITLGTLAVNNGELITIAYMSMLGIFYLLGTTKYFKRQKRRNNGYLAIGALGTTTMLMTLSFDGFWNEIARNSFWSGGIGLPETIAAVLATAIAGTMLYVYNQKGPWIKISPISFIFLLFIPVFILGTVNPLAATVVINLILLTLGLLTIKRGASNDNLGLMNYGLLIITGLITCRFFDGDITYVLRGIMFLIVGLGFFGTNFWMLNLRANKARNNKNLTHAV